ncbi:MAG: KPN_02809 family neutral zinc metallopeptidase [Gemmatimonadota bacterium]
MQWRSGRRSTNVEDRRGMRPGIAVGGGMGLLILLLIVWCMGGDPLALLQTQTAPQAPSTGSGPAPAAEDEAAQFVSAILATTEDAWGTIFAENGVTYPSPTLVLFTDMVRSACGTSSSATGPFYCPLDQKVYLDLGFFRELARLGGPGDFAAAYVIGHEVGHHVQTVVGTGDEVRSLQQRRPGDANDLSVRLELQADCYAGVWAHRANRDQGGNFLEEGDVDEGLAAAAAIGDDRLQRTQGRAMNPESFTHGTSTQRQQWLRRGLDSGDPDACDTFGAGA